MMGFGLIPVWGYLGKAALNIYARLWEHTFSFFSWKCL